MLSSRRTLAEITARVEDALGHYEQGVSELDEGDDDNGTQPQEATLAQQAEAGRARADVYVYALNEISSERRVLLGDLKAKLEGERLQAERAEKDERRMRATTVDDDGEETMDEAMLLERLDTLEVLQRKLGSTGEAILEMSRASGSGPLIRSLQEVSQAPLMA